jgi:predicted  nucleic acid-binding Zn-ribbon protein
MVRPIDLVAWFVLCAGASVAFFAVAEDSRNIAQLTHEIDALKDKIVKLEVENDLLRAR